MSTRGVHRVTVGAVVATVGLVAPAVGSATARGLDRTTLTASVSATVVATDGAVRVKGKVTADGPREVRLQRLDGRRWRTVTTLDSTGTYSMRVPTRTPGVTSYRVQAPAEDGFAAATTRAFTVGVGEGSTRSHAFLTAPPVRWNPCDTVGYRVNLTDAPPKALDDVKKAVSLASAASGVRFAYKGTTKIVPGASSTTEPDDYPADTDLVIAFTRPGRTEFFAGRSQVLGVGGVFYDLTPQKVGRSTWHQAVQGYVVLNGDHDLPRGFGPGREEGVLGTWGQVLMHEIGHTMGLDHPVRDDKAQIMYPESTYKKAVWGAGDLAGLRKVGRVSGCFAAPSGKVGPGARNEMLPGIGR